MTVSCSTQGEDGQGTASEERRAMDIPAEQVCVRAGGMGVAAGGLATAQEVTVEKCFKITSFVTTSKKQNKKAVPSTFYGYRTNTSSRRKEKMI